MPHLGRHPHLYHDFVLDGMKQAAKKAGGNRELFLQFFNENVIQKIIDNPQLLRKSGW